MIAPLHIAAFPTIGPTGERDNIERLIEIHTALLPPGRLMFLDIAHDDDCPCADGAHATAACTCDTVDVTLRLHDPRTS